MQPSTSIHGWINPSNRTVRIILVFSMLFFSMLIITNVVNWRSLTKATRYQHAFERWYEDGFIANYGLIYTQKVFENVSGWEIEDPNKPIVYKSSGPGFLLPLYGLQALYHWFFGKFKIALDHYYAAFLVLIGSLVIGEISFTALTRQKFPPWSALLLSSMAALTFQNFPQNLLHTVVGTQDLTATVLLLIFLWVSYGIVLRGKATLGQGILRGVLVGFMAFSSTPVMVVSLICAWGLLIFLRWDGNERWSWWVWQGLFPSVIGLLAFALQIWIGVHVLDVQVVGSHATSRLGLFPSGEGIVFNYMDLLKVNRYSFWAWADFFVLSVFVFGFILVDSRRSHRFGHFGGEIYVLLISIGFYLVMTGSFLQLVVIHPYVYDQFLMIPSIISVFVFSPVILDRLFGKQDRITMIMAIFGMIYIINMIKEHAVYVRAFSA